MNNEEQPAAIYKKDSENFTSDAGNKVTIPVIEEQLIIAKQTIEAGKVYIKKQVHEQLETVNVSLLHDEYDIEHIPVNEYVDDAPEAVRYEGTTMIVSVIKEVMVKRLVLVEEIRISKRVAETTEQQDIMLRKEEVTIERQAN